ncbi:hypothetical protein [Allokutzneria sp. NRRL B-24872]|uniref:hypothetical protein n=1 Tax=Allokutzneria sp. NRRL B-24872 TaxID=1137961 RepID=UPI000A3AEF8C|nr:hypothetical protein [Allokutzneria sp. NRRL B-24872]
MSEDRHFTGGDNYESKSLEELRALLGDARTALAAQLATEISERGAGAKRLADGMNELAAKLQGRWESGSVTKAKAAGDLLRSYGDEQEQIARGIGQPFVSMAHAVKQVAEHVKELKLGGLEFPKTMPTGLRPEEITALRESMARQEQAKEALRQEAIELGRSLDREAERTDRVAPRFDDLPSVFSADPPPRPRPPEGGGGGGFTPPRGLPGERGGGAFEPMPSPVPESGRPGPTPSPESWRPGEVEQTGWDRPGGGQVDGGRSGGSGFDSGRGGAAGGGGTGPLSGPGGGSFGGGSFGGGSFGGGSFNGSSSGGQGTEPRRAPGAAPTPPAGRGGGPTGVPGTVGRAGQGGFMQPAVPGTAQGAEDEEHDRRYPYVEDLVGELPKVAPPVIGE